MGVFRSVGKGIGTVGGGLIGGAVKLTGKAIGTKFESTGEWIEEIGENVKTASEVAFDNAGQFVDGAVQGTYGLIKQDEYYKQQGLEDLKDSTGRTIKGIGSAIKYTAKNVGNTYTGFRSGDDQKTIRGLKNLGKVVAISTLAVGVVDLIDGANMIEAEELDTRNDSLAGLEHPETGVPFLEKEVVVNGQPFAGTFPVFDSDFSVIIAEDLYYESDAVHFGIANDTLYQAIQGEPNLTSELGLSQADIQSLANGQTPEGYTWHHSEEAGVLQLVDEEIHAQTGHTGGREIWGGGSEYR
ncbi:HNH endonuclease [Robertmurraya andreesenii]|uniref:HNH endonuclease n=1 Tax=Anoxybacillus andreesenii TaxID=1325932 RepID=A0ABT9VAB0_9BACL|nr:HNH endonuclease [Robertmurraya andreesenii]MDQ0157903.1 hypothetical protein [Robertmurraya andreesenii]